MSTLPEPNPYPQAHAVEIVADGLRVLTTRDQVPIPEELIQERARNIVASLGADFDLVPHEIAGPRALADVLVRIRARNAKATALLVLMVAGALGCGESLAPSCAPIPDGTYTAPAGDSYTFVGGQPSGNWSCVPTVGCPGQLGCTPIGETVYTVEFVNEGDGTIEATTSPPDDTVTLTRKGGV